MLPFLGSFQYRRDGSLIGVITTNFGLFAVVRNSLFNKMVLAGLNVKDLASSNFKELCVS